MENSNKVAIEITRKIKETQFEIDKLRQRILVLETLHRVINKCTRYNVLTDKVTMDICIRTRDEVLIKQTRAKKPVKSQESLLANRASNLLWYRNYFVANPCKASQRLLKEDTELREKIA